MESIDLTLNVTDYNKKRQVLVSGKMRISVTLDDNILDIHEKGYSGDITTKQFKKDLIDAIKNQYDPEYTEVIEVK